MLRSSFLTAFGVRVVSNSKLLNSEKVWKNYFIGNKKQFDDEFSAVCFFIPYCFSLVNFKLIVTLICSFLSHQN